ncbi:serine hydrolase domain-containing protein [Arenibacter sp. F20364]|uniref:serine hydrolase domain-containing protein n=1 Tax=Arenibacter sp. F20364 TaxID=2926415 RepID=UPI001FF4A519|nr:serine hydrolase domain-containing protein [Arenibacter sp. F20364]MCK0189224.1 beta-lactamase family protein [Arenibacter sp. F20364]
MLKLIKGHIVLFGCLLWMSFLQAQNFSIAQPEEVGMSSERLERLSATLDQYVKEGKMSGNVALVARKGKIIYHKAFGESDMEAGKKMTNDAIFRIASQTKAIVSVAVMILQEEGKLLIADPVGKYLPEWKETTVAKARDDGGYDVVKANRSITIRDLLTHTAGIGYGHGPAKKEWEEAGIQNWYFADRNEPIAETIARMSKLPMDAHPGERFVYGYNTDILGVIVEKVSGKALDVFIQERVLNPVGMVDTYFYLPKNKADRLATSYMAYNGKPLERSPDPGLGIGQGHYVKGPRKSFSGGAGLLSTAMDYAKFLQMMLNGGEFNGNRILSPKTVELMIADHVDVRGIPYGSRSGSGFGLGFSITKNVGERGEPGSVGTFEWGGAYGSTYWADPEEDLVVVYFKQLIPTNGLDDHAKLRSLVYQAILE